LYSETLPSLPLYSSPSIDTSNSINLVTPKFEFIFPAYLTFPGRRATWNYDYSSSFPAIPTNRSLLSPPPTPCALLTLANLVSGIICIPPRRFPHYFLTVNQAFPLFSQISRLRSQASILSDQGALFPSHPLNLKFTTSTKSEAEGIRPPHHPPPPPQHQTPSSPPPQHPPTPPPPPPPPPPTETPPPPHTHTPPPSDMGTLSQSISPTSSS